MLDEDLCSPERPNTNSFQALVESLTKHLQPAQTIIAEGTESDESVSEYIAVLQSLVKHCNYMVFFCPVRPSPLSHGFNVCLYIILVSLT